MLLCVLERKFKGLLKWEKASLTGIFCVSRYHEAFTQYCCLCSDRKITCVLHKVGEDLCLLSVEESVSDLWMYEVKVNFGFQMDTDFWCSLIYQLICVIMNREHATVNSTQQLLCRHDVIMTDQSWSQSHEGQVISLCECSLTELQPMTSQRRRLLFTCFEV